MDSLKKDTSTRASSIECSRRGADKSAQMREVIHDKVNGKPMAAESETSVNDNAAKTNEPVSVDIAEIKDTVRSENGVKSANESKLSRKETLCGSHDSVHESTDLKIVNEGSAINGLSKRCQNCEQSTKENSRKSSQAVSEIPEYTRLIEERIEALEKGVKLLKEQSSTADPGKDSSETDVESSTDISNVPMLVPKLRKKTWSEFDPKRITHSVDIIYGQLGGNPNKESHSTSASAADGKAFGSTGGSLSGRSGRPSRIIIQSRPLQSELRKVTDFDITPTSREIIPPFKPFISCDKKIRAHLKILEQHLRALKKEEEALLKDRELPSEVRPLRERPLTPTPPVGPPSKTFGEENKLEADSLREEVAEVAEVGRLCDEKQKIIENADAGGEQKADTPDIPDTKRRKSVAAVEPPVFPTEAPPENDLLPEEVRWSPQSIGSLMVVFRISRKAALAKLCKGGNLDALGDAYTELQSADGTNEPTRRKKVLEAYILVEEWKLIIELLDKDLADILNLREEIESQKLQLISFEDLGHLFQPGQMVLESKMEGKEQQLLRVFSSTGGRRINDDRRKKEDEDATERTVSTFSNFVVDCYYIDFDGEHFRPAMKSFTINPYYIVMPISSLSICPTWSIKEVKKSGWLAASLEKKSGGTTKDEIETMKAVDDEGTDLWSLFLERGKVFADLCNTHKVGHRQYCGLSLGDPPEQVDSKVIIDFKMASLLTRSEQPDGEEWMPELDVEATEPDERELDISSAGARIVCFLKDCTSCKPQNILLDDLRFSEKQSRDFVGEIPIFKQYLLNEQQKLEDDDYRLLPYRLFGFILRSRKWARLNIANISAITHEEDNFKKLVLPDGYADIVQALVETHTAKDREKKEAHEVDLVKGKGKGLIILLHGAPGVGKTSTAECVADHTHRPLYPITCGDLGDTAASVEKNLERCFQLAHKWGCVLLLDEADVFLAQRSRTDLQRNALVSVFLRVLEYYAGILFLTTNRVGTFDEAFKSRIHMSLGYPPLDYTQTLEIWKMNLKRTRKAKGLGLEIEKKKILKFAEKHFQQSHKTHPPVGAWNGRQIRNAFQTAIALAKWDFEQGKHQKSKPFLDDEHFKKVAKASRQFDRYLKEVSGGMTESQQALDEGLRADDINVDNISPEINKAHYGNDYKAGKRQSSTKEKGDNSRPSKTKKAVQRPDHEPEPDSSDEEHKSDKEEESDIS